jgi:hypothetical protein
MASADLLGQGNDDARGAAEVAEQEDALVLGYLAEEFGALVRIATCIGGRVEVMVNCAPLVNYGTINGTWSYQGDRYNAMTIAAKDADVELALAGSIRLGVLGVRGYGRTTLTEGQSAYVVLSWGDAKVPASQEEAFSALNTTIGFWRDWLSAAKIPRAPVEAVPRPQRADPQGAQLQAHRRDHGGGDDLATGDPWRGAQLGLPVHLDPGLLVHAPGAVPAGFWLGGDRVLGVCPRCGHRR